MASDASTWSFDRAAGFYDATRGLPPAVAGQLAEVLATELRGRGRCLEIGVGTGRIALPLAAAGIDLVGTDVAAEMVAQLVANDARRRAVRGVPVALADATALPFPDGTFGAVLASHVLHLIPAWQSAVDEALRVLRPDGVLLVDFGGGVPAPWNEPTLEIFRRHGIERRRPGVSRPEPVAEHLGVPVRPLPPVPMQVTKTLAEDLADWEGQIFSWTWHYPQEQIRAACTQIREWAAAEGLQLDEVVTLERRLQWWAFERAAS